MNDNWYLAKVRTGDEGAAVDALLAVDGIERPFSFAPGYVMFLCADIATVESQINSLHAIQSINTTALQPWEAESWLRPPGDWAELPELGSTAINDCPARVAHHTNTVRCARAPLATHHIFGHTLPTAPIATHAFLETPKQNRGLHIDVRLPNMVNYVRASARLGSLAPIVGLWA